MLTDEGQARQRELGRRHARDVARIMRGRVTTDDLAALRTICGKLAGGAMGPGPGDGTGRADGRGPRPPRSRAADGIRRKADISA